MPRPRQGAALVVLRALVLLLGTAAGVLLERDFAAGATGAIGDLTATHVLFGLLLAAVVMPGPLLGAVVTPRARPRIRGLAVGGSVFTAFVAFVGFVFTRRGSMEGFRSAAAFSVVWFWCFLAFILAVHDTARLVRGEPEGE